MIANPPVELTDLSQVERALAASRAGGPGSVRATTLNLVVYAPTAEDMAFTQRALERIGGSRPLRAIIAGTGADGVRATVSASCWLGSGLQQVCSEQVLLTAREGALPSAVVSLLVRRPAHVRVVAGADAAGARAPVRPGRRSARPPSSTRTSRRSRASTGSGGSSRR